MNDFIRRIRAVFLPFLILSILFILIYSFLNWLIFIKLELFSIKETYVNFGLPYVLSFISVLIWLRPRIKVLNLDRKNGDLYFLYQFIASIVIFVPTLIAQEYLSTATGELSIIENVQEVEKQSKSKFYQIKKIYIDKKDIGIKNVFETNGNHNENFIMHIYVAIPILATVDDTIKNISYAWYGKKYYKRISNKLEPSDKEKKFKEFANESQMDFESFNPYDFIYFDRIGNSDDRDGYLEAMKTSSKFSENYTTILIPINEPFENRNGNKLIWIFISFGIGATVWLLMLIVPKLNETILCQIEKGKQIKDTELIDFINFIKPRDGYFIVPIIIYINLLIFIIMAIYGLGFMSFKGHDLLNWGANYRPLTIKDGEWWRLITNIFLHGGLMHLLFNMYGLIFVGLFIEPILGKAKFLFIYLLTGIIASLASLWWYEATVSVGASGAIFGMYGLFLAFMLSKIFHPEFTKSFLLSILLFIGFNLLMGLAGGIDNAAHIGGLLGGFFIGLVISPLLKKEEIL